MGILGARSKSPKIGVQRLLRRMAGKKHASVWPGFLDELRKLAVSEDEALDAAKKLTEKGRVRRFAEGAAIGGVAAPLTNAVGEATRGYLQHGAAGGRAGAAKGIARAFSRPEAARSAVTGALGGTTVQGIREGLEIGRAKDTYKSFMRERGGT